ncbi:radical SAM family heme chaperone HemW [Schlesneria sp. DSM 10557]|uniref:radical SAM family heme chaperone HemW n=1 Tax=Schlesneria sp. DSM 10557 TaxID=3044399 RepID=UPI0035A010B5
MPHSVYIHVPFCAHRCGYCDFTLVAGRDDLVQDYLRALELEIKTALVPPAVPVKTIFFGGGTPTHPQPDELRRLFELVRRTFPHTPETEFSVEANPLDLTEEKLQLLQEAGVNRISLGVQSFSPHSLKLLERDHDPVQIVDVMRRLKPRFENISLDLIFGVPGQTLEDWRCTLRQAIDLEPAHISAYGLTFEKGTEFWTRRERGQLQAADEELERDQYALAMEILPQAQFHQYEISNYARPGFECRHNQVYWSGDEYWAFGPGAARYVGGRRETNIRSVLGWLSRIERGESPVADAEELAPDHRARELVYLGLRRSAGLQRTEFFARTGIKFDELYRDTLKEQIQLGLVTDDGETVKLTLAGRFVADRVAMEFL